jgi:hypothetical protein
MPIETISQVRYVAVNADQVLALYNQGKTLKQIRDQLAPLGSVMCVWRALRRAQRAGGVVKPRGTQCPAL